MIHTRFKGGKVLYAPAYLMLISCALHDKVKLDQMILADLKEKAQSRLYKLDLLPI